ncbi:MAG: GGDEF domain-containing protein [Methylobacterium mesophilicum]|nr:GGDEF domain-containing protein [Methylobacterium mesophilicum]
MSSAGVALFTNLVVAVLLASAFFAISFHDGRRAARWIALSYATGMAALSLEFVIAGFGASTLMVVVNFGGFLLATLFFNVGVARRIGKAVPWALMGTLFGVSLLTTWASAGWTEQLFLGAVVYQLPYALMQWIGVGIILSDKGRDRFDTLLGAVLAISGVQFLLKPVMKWLSGGLGQDPALYLESTYAVISLSMSAICALALALTMLAMFARDVLRDVTQRAEIDPMSGALNRGGFERQAEAALRDAAEHGLPVSVVLADLDHFKQVNDTLGHASGDRVIEAFGTFIRSAGEHRLIAGRIGGEEFAMVLPGVNLAAARLFAENARAAFGSLAIAGLPLQRRFTASFGVAEGHQDEALDSMLRRADEALYRAKAEGRDCVRTALPYVSEGLGPASATGASPVARRYRTNSVGVNR